MQIAPLVLDAWTLRASHGETHEAMARLTHELVQHGALPEGAHMRMPPARPESPFERELECHLSPRSMLSRRLSFSVAGDPLESPSKSVETIVMEVWRGGL